MNLLGVHLTLWIGNEVPGPAPLALVEALQSVEITHNDEGSSGFQITFQVGRSSILDLIDYKLLANPLLKPFSRVILIVRFAIAPQVLMDGIITNQQLSPSNEPGASTLTVTGEDVGVMMDLVEQHREFPALPDYAIVAQIVGNYVRYGLTPPLPPANPHALNPRNPIEEITQQPATLTDRGYLQELAQQYGFLFYITPGPLPRASTVHWGPPERLSVPQGALSVNMGPATNVESINFSFDALRPQQVGFTVDGKRRTISSPTMTRNIPLASDRAQMRRTVYLTDDDNHRAEIRAQGMVDQSFDGVVTANAQVDAMRYNGLINPRGLIGVRGAGRTYDGLYYVKSVTHRISRGRYSQNLVLTREGTGTTTPFVRP